MIRSEGGHDRIFGKSEKYFHEIYMNNLICIKIYGDRNQAELAASFLRSQGIECSISVDDVGTMEPALTVSSGIQLLVNPNDSDEAKELLSDPQILEDDVEFKILKLRRRTEGAAALPFVAIATASLAFLGIRYINEMPFKVLIGSVFLLLSILILKSWRDTLKLKKELEALLSAKQNSKDAG